MRDKTGPAPALLGRLWLFPTAYLLHIVEERWGVGRGIHLSAAQFFLYSGAAWALMVFGVVLARRRGFLQFIQVCLASVFLVNGFSHLIKCVRIAGFDAGVITGTLIFIPLGAFTLFALRRAMSRRRYFVAVAIGFVMQVVATLLSK